MANLQTLIARDKRKSDRLPLSLNVFYSVPPSDSSWRGPITMKNLSGNGLSFHTPSCIRKNATLNFKIELPGRDKPIICKGDVSWSKKAPSTKDYLLGVKFNKMAYADRRHFVTFIFKELLRQKLTLE